MPLVNLRAVLDQAEARRGAVLGMVCLGWEDAAEFVAAGEATGVPVILQAGPGARAAIPTEVWGQMFRSLGARAKVPVVAHLDHGKSPDECFAALDAGFTSVMFDGSKLPLAENIAATNRVAARARPAGASVEAEVGFVGYDDGAPSEGTSPEEAERFANEADIDCLAVSAGNVHLATEQKTPLDWESLGTIRQRVAQPLVLHGGSGIPSADRARAISEFHVCKINLGTEIRQAYGAALRAVLDEEPGIFDRLKIAKAVAKKRAALVQSALLESWR